MNRPAVFFVSGVNFEQLPPERWNDLGQRYINGLLTSENEEKRSECIKVIEFSAYKKVCDDWSEVRKVAQAATLRVHDLEQKLDEYAEALKKLKLYLGNERWTSLFGDSP